MRLGRDIALRPEQAVWLLLALIAAGACAVVISTQSYVFALAIPVLVLLPLVVPLIDAGVFVGVALVLADNALVGVNLEHFAISGAVNGTDVAFLAIFAFALIRHVARPTVRPSRHVSLLLSVWSIVFLTLWGVDFVRALDTGTHVLQALSLGREFLYFGITLPFAASLITTDTELRHLCIVVGALSVLFAVADIAATLGVAPSSIANSALTLSLDSLNRVYNTAYFLFELTFSAAVAYALLHSGRGARIASAIALVTAAALLLSFGRALYIGVVVGLVATFVLWMIGQGSAQRLLRRRLSGAVAALVIAGVVVFSAAPSLLNNGPVSAVTKRVTSVTSALGSSSIETSTVAYREHVDSLMFQVLGDRWVTGLGFLAPQTNYFVDLPEGSIRDNDLGVTNSLMTMGVIGTVLLYLPPVWLLCALLARAWRRVDRYSHFWMAGTAWLLIALTTTTSLGSLASVSGLATITVGMGVLLLWLSRDERERVLAGHGAQVGVPA